MSLEERWGPAILNLGFHDIKSLIIKRIVQFLTIGVIAETTHNRSNLFLLAYSFFRRLYLGDRIFG